MKKVKKEKYWVHKFGGWYQYAVIGDDECLAKFYYRKDAIAFCKMKNKGDSK